MQMATTYVVHSDMYTVCSLEPQKGSQGASGLTGAHFEKCCSKLLSEKTESDYPNITNPSITIY